MDWMLFIMMLLVMALYWILIHVALDGLESKVRQD